MSTFYVQVIGKTAAWLNDMDENKLTEWLTFVATLNDYLRNIPNKMVGRC